MALGLNATAAGAASSQVLVFNYGAQAGCRFPVPTPEEARHQDPAAVSLNNEW